ncbi:MAG: hypothetical protein JWR61_1334 [Ferruginibacter sp.]|uniref:T9SS type B sorting domain-containing protein n=1 Tax=Ferruginibacter sp. TaxID=1940288 RepID=UPI002658EA94|nr:gliding motility-associated C-terminal domain-containing protein [Ferruginibacter sp.]MDB5276379.1 hypothetical protein [Ferruginibacter sp.]
MRNKCFILIIFLFNFTNAVSQKPIFQWAKAFVGNGNQSAYSNGRSVAVDKQGNVYSAGLFGYTVDFDPGPGVFMLAAGNWANTAIYLSKLSPSGDFLWAIQIPTYVEFGNIEIRVDKDDNVCIASELRLPTDFDPGTGVYMLSPTGGWDAFVAKYNPSGNLVWAKQFGGPGDTVPRSDVLSIDNDNNVIVCGNFNNTVDFDPGPAVYNITSTAHIQAFIVKLTSNGDFIWAKQFGTSPVVYSGSNIADVKSDSGGNIYLTGDFAGECDFDPGPASYLLKSHGLRDAYIAKLTPDGNYIWCKSVGNTTGDYYQYSDTHGIAVDSKQNVYVTGDFMGTFDFDPGAATHIISSSNYDWYLLKLNVAGEFGWVDAFAGSGSDGGADVAIGNDGMVNAVGFIGQTTDMDPGPGVYPVTTLNQYGGSALVKVDQDGGFIYAVPFDQPATDYGDCLTRRMALDDMQNIYITGYLSGTVDFDPGPNVYPLYSGNSEAPFVLKLSRCTNVTTSTLNISTCDNYMLNNETFDSTGIYIRRITNSIGCDSIITLHLTINKKYTQQIKTICQGESFFAGGAKQTVSGIYLDTLASWTNCDSIVTTSLTVSPKPAPALGPDTDLCAGTQLVISPGSFTNYLWQDMSASGSFTVKAEGVFWVRVTNSFNCSATDSFIVRNILPTPANFLKKKDSICSYDKLNIIALQPYKQYLWSTGSFENGIVAEQPGEYWLKVTDVNGCVATDTVTVYKKDCMNGVYIPTAFSPGNDGKNDIFRASVFGRLLSFKLQIFNRAGQVIFQTTDPAKGWDGTHNGTKYSTSVFVWQCSYQLDQQKPSFRKGTVTIVR